MFHPQKTVAASAAEARSAITRLARPTGNFDASRYFRGDHGLGFYNVGTVPMRALARSIHAAQRGRWRVIDAMAFADVLVADRYLEVKSVGIEVVARYRRDFTPALLGRWKRWLSANYSANWATTDAICGMLIGPLLVSHPRLAPQLRAWSRHRNMWVRRASIVGLLPLVRHGGGVDLVYEIARTLHADPEDLIQKAVGWALREAGKVDRPRLERYLRANVRDIPRTTFRYAIERFPPMTRQRLLNLPSGPRLQSLTPNL
jgi:3-methyladenine DNA glycosylase AlkD